MADHIQVPQAWMKNFMHKTEDGEKVFYLSCKDGKIDEEKIKKLGAEENYYVPDFEKYLGSRWETKFGELSKKIRKNIKETSERIGLSTEEYFFLKRFLTLSIGRSKTFKKEVLKRSDNRFTFIGINEIVPLSVLEEEPIFNDYNVQFLYNRTKIGFVLPSYTYYYIGQAFGISPIMVLTDKIAVRFLKKEENNEFNAIVNGSILHIDDEENIKNYNYYALITEINTNNDFLIAKSENELNVLKNGG